MEAQPPWTFSTIRIQVCWRPGAWLGNQGCPEEEQGEWAQAPLPAFVQSLQGQKKGFSLQDRQSEVCLVSRSPTVQSYSALAQHTQQKHGLKRQGGTLKNGGCVFRCQPHPGADRTSRAAVGGWHLVPAQHVPSPRTCA